MPGAIGAYPRRSSLRRLGLIAGKLCTLFGRLPAASLFSPSRFPRSASPAILRACMPEPIDLPTRQRRSALEALSRERLARITGHYDLRVADRRSATSHVDAIVRANRVDFAEVLSLLDR